MEKNCLTQYKKQLKALTNVSAFNIYAVMRQITHYIVTKDVKIKLISTRRYKIMVKIYVSLIRKDKRTIASVPEKIRAEVQSELDK